MFEISSFNPIYGGRYNEVSLLIDITVGNVLNHKYSEMSDDGVK